MTNFVIIYTISKILEKYPECTRIKYWEDKDKWINEIWVKKHLKRLNEI